VRWHLVNVMDIKRQNKLHRVSKRKKPYLLHASFRPEEDIDFDDYLASQVRMMMRSINTEPP
jgi:hypothetical protein